MFANVDHVMTYLFTDAGEIPGFNVLGRALDEAGRMPLRLPSMESSHTGIVTPFELVERVGCGLARGRKRYA
jgi:hypothetical protein